MTKIDWKHHREQFARLHAESGVKRADYIRDNNLPESYAVKKLPANPNQPPASTAKPKEPKPAPRRVREKTKSNPKTKELTLPPDIEALLGDMQADRVDAELVQLVEEAIREFCAAADKGIDHQRRAVLSYDGDLQPDDEGYIEPLCNEKGQPLPPHNEYDRRVTKKLAAVTEAVKSLGMVLSMRGKSAQNTLAQRSAEYKNQIQRERMLEEDYRAQLARDVIAENLTAMTRDEQPISVMEAAHNIERQGIPLPESLAVAVRQHIGTDDGRNDPPLSDEELDAEAVAAIEKAKEWERDIKERAAAMELERRQAAEFDDEDGDALPDYIDNPDRVDVDASAADDCVITGDTEGEEDE